MSLPKPPDSDGAPTARLAGIRHAPSRSPASDLDIVAQALQHPAAQAETAFLDPKSIKPHPQLEQRTVYAGVEELAQSIAELGQQQPVGVWRKDDGDFLIWGYSRLRALLHSLNAGKQIYARIYRRIDLDTAHRLAVAENFQRSQLSPLDKARLVAASTERGWSQTLIARVTQMDRKTVRRLERLHEAARKSAALQRAAALPDFPLSAADAFVDLEAWVLEDDTLNPVLDEVIAGTMTTQNLKRTLRTLLGAKPETEDARQRRAQPYRVYANGAFRLRPINIAANASAEDYAQRVKTLRDAIRRLQQLQRDAQRQTGHRSPSVETPDAEDSLKSDEDHRFPLRGALLEDTPDAT